MLIEHRCKELLDTVSYASLTKSEQERLIVLLIHDIGVAALASHTDLARGLLDPELLLDGDSGYSLFGRIDTSRSFDMAVEYNAMAVTASLREDFVNGTHPGAILFPLLLAEVERTSLSLEKMLDAAAAGLKISMLLLDTYGKAASDKGYRPTTVINIIAGAAALARAQGATADEALRAMSAAAGMMQGFAFPFQEGTEEWFVQVPAAAHVASLACRNAQVLHFSHEQFLSGERSLGSLLGVVVATDVPQEELALSLNLTRIGVKRHPVNSFVQPVVEATLRLGSLDGVETASIEEVVVTVPQTFAGMPTLLNQGPLSSPNLGLLSIPISTALALIQQRLEFFDFRRSNDSSVLKLAKKVQVVFSPDLAQYDVRVTVRSATTEWESALATAFFYPSLDEELAWVRQHYVGALPWIDTLVDWFAQHT